MGSWIKDTEKIKYVDDINWITIRPEGERLSVRFQTDERSKLARPGDHITKIVDEISIHFNRENGAINAYLGLGETWVDTGGPCKAGDALVLRLKGVVTAEDIKQFLEMLREAKAEFRKKERVKEK